MVMGVRSLANQAKAASYKMMVLPANVKNAVLEAVAAALETHASEIIAANAEDIARAEAKSVSGALLDRLRLTPERVRLMARSAREVMALDDPIGGVDRSWKRPNGLLIGQKRVPLGVIGIIYEARPNVTVEAMTLCIKSGNAVVLRGGSEAISTNIAIMRILQPAMREAGLPEGAVSLVEDTSRDAALEMMRLNGLIDVLIPRGGASLIRSVVENASVPTIETGLGNCHIYVDEGSERGMALRIIDNAKTQRPAVCNAVETVLVHEGIASGFLPDMADILRKKGVEIRGCEKCRAVVPEILPASEADWEEEYHDLVLAVKVVSGVGEAIDHINRYGTRHSEAIITENYANAQRFLDEVDAAAVYVNASTRFTDGGEFGFGAEMGISTQKLHARGPMGLMQLTTIKYVVEGNGQIRD